MSSGRDRFDRDEFEPPAGEPNTTWRPHQPPRPTQVRAQEAVRRASARGQRPGCSGLRKPGLLIGLFIGGLAALAFAIYIIVSNSSQPATQPSSGSQPPAAQAPAGQQAQPSTPARTNTGESPITGIFGSPSSNSQPAEESWLTTAARILLKLALAALLAAMLAFRPRKDLPVLQRNPYVAQTQILLAVVASALMMIVADNAARAFGIFAAASLVRFRTNIRDPKEITVLLISLGIGLATGVGRVEVGIILALFVLIMLWVLEYYEPAQVFRAMEVVVTTRRVDETDEILREVFEKRNLTYELREVNREDPDDPLGKIVYYVNVSSSVSTDQLSEEIFASDPENIDSIQWDQKKSTSYIYR